MWNQARDKHRQQMGELIEHRRASLTRSHQARIAAFEEQPKKTDDENIHRMRSSQIKSAELDFERRMKGIEQSRNKCDIIAELIARGALSRRYESIWIGHSQATMRKHYLSPPDEVFAKAAGIAMVGSGEQPGTKCTFFFVNFVYPLCPLW